MITFFIISIFLAVELNHFISQVTSILRLTVFHIRALAFGHDDDTLHMHICHMTVSLCLQKNPFER